jgi:PadR family transcriptional regulator, regulatory protein PadR
VPCTAFRRFHRGVRRRHVFLPVSLPLIAAPSEFPGPQSRAVSCFGRPRLPASGVAGGDHGSVVAAFPEQPRTRSADSVQASRIPSDRRLGHYPTDLALAFNSQGMIHIKGMHHAPANRPRTRSTGSSPPVWPSRRLLRRVKAVDNNLMAQIRKGTTAWIILSTLQKRGELYGYGLRHEVWTSSKGTFLLQEGPLYRLLGRMERARWLTSRRAKVAGRDRRYYHICPRGRQVLAQYRRDWRLLSSVLDSLSCLRTE